MGVQKPLFDVQGTICSPPISATPERLTLVQKICLSILLLIVTEFCFAIDMKVDRVLINQPLGGAAVWSTVTFQQPFGSVPIVFVTPSNSNADPATVRIRNITTTGFEVGVVEPEGSNGQTSQTDVSYFAAETGSYTFPGGIRVLVSSYSTTTSQGRYVAGSAWDDVNFSTAFSSAPAVIAQVQTINSQPTLDQGVVGSPFLEVTIRNVTTVDMDVALERAETSSGTVVSETIGYLAVESGNELSLGGETIKTLRTADNIRGWSNGCTTSNYPSGFTSTPLIVASQNSRDGGDGGWVRTCSISTTQVGLTIDEDVANDSERAHTTEEAGVLAVSGAFHGQRNGRDMEAGSVSITSSNTSTSWTTVNFPIPFNSLPNIFALPTDQGAPPAALRIRNVSVNGFDIAAFQPGGGVGGHSQMEVDYLAIINGEFTLPNGDIFESGTTSTNLYLAGTGGSTGTTNILFNGTFGGAPAVMLQIQTINNEPTADPNSISTPWMTTTVTNLTGALVTTALERAESVAGSISSDETVAYFAIRNGANDSFLATDGSTINYQAFITPDNIRGYDDGCYNNNYITNFSSPFAIATQASRGGPNGGWVRRCNLETGRIGLFVDEDQALDSERAHTSELASVVVFSQAFEAEFSNVDHYAIYHAGSGVNCEATTVTIGAHNNADLGVDAQGRQITITATSSSPGWLSSHASFSLETGTGSFAVTGPGEAEYTFGLNESVVEVALANTSVADIDIDITDLEPGITDNEGSSEDPLLSFSAAGIQFYNDTDGDGNADAPGTLISPIVSGNVSGQYILRAVQTNNSSGACEAGVAGNQSVLIGYECTDPSTCVRTQDAEINNNVINENDSGASPISYATTPLFFDADGEAAFSIEYFDVGEIRLHAQLDVAVVGGGGSITINGTSDELTFTPATITITDISDNSGQPNPGTTTSGSGFIPADTPFSITLEVRNSVGGLTPNFGNESSPERLTVTTNSLIMPSSGDLPGLTSGANFLSTGTGGEFLNSTVRWAEAGTITIQAEILDQNYLGHGNVQSAISGNVGRFYPSLFVLLTHTTSNSCPSGGFSYMSDALFTYTPINTNYSVEAASSGLNRLLNYDDNFPVSSFVYMAEDQNNGSDLSNRWSGPSASWVDGVYDITSTANSGFSRAATGTPEQPSGPYSSLQIGIQPIPPLDPTDFDAVDYNMNATTSSDCVAAGNCNAISIGTALNFIYGRLSIEDQFGPETSQINVPLQIEYWDQNQFLLNTFDNCTSLSMADIAFESQTLDTDSNRTVTVGGGNSTGTFNSFTPGVTLAFTGGEAGLSFSPPGANNVGSIDIDIDLSNYPWLRHDWDQSGDASNDSDLPTATVQFGRYRGHDRVIFWNEVFQ